MNHKLSIGSAQFGLDYGIANHRGRIPLKEVFDILAHALSRGVCHVDTAPGYGDSETVIGRFCRETGKRLRVTTKLTARTGDDAAASVEASLDRLGSSALYGVLVHDFQCLNADIIDSLCRLRTRGLTRHIGCSLYYPSELLWIMDSAIPFDMVQVPVSLCDRRFIPLFEKAAARGIRIQARSVFLQGLFFMDRATLPVHLKSAARPLLNLDQLCRENRLGVYELCLAYAARQSGIDSVVIGVDSLENLKQNLDTDWERASAVLSAGDLDDIQIHDEDILVPSRW